MCSSAVTERRWVRGIQVDLKLPASPHLAFGSHKPPESCPLLQKRMSTSRETHLLERYPCKLPLIPKAREPGKVSPNPTRESRGASPWWCAHLTRGAFAPGHHPTPSCHHPEAGQCRTRRQAGDHLDQKDVCHLPVRAKLCSPGSKAG